MIGRGFQCDNCGKTVVDADEDWSAFVIRGLPDGWYSIVGPSHGRVRNDLAVDCREFCSAECATVGAAANVRISAP